MCLNKLQVSNIIQEFIELIPVSRLRRGCKNKGVTAHICWRTDSSWALSSSVSIPVRELRRLTLGGWPDSLHEVGEPKTLLVGVEDGDAGNSLPATPVTGTASAFTTPFWSANIGFTTSGSLDSPLATAALIALKQKRFEVFEQEGVNQSHMG